MRTRWLFVAVITLFFPATAAVGASGPPVHGPVNGLQHVGHGTALSLNWSGYAIYNNGSGGRHGSSPATFDSATGSWTQPNVVGSCPNKTTLAAFYVGIDGYNSNSVEQIGTDTDCLNGVATPVAWYEMYPAGPVYLSSNAYPVNPRDVMTASVTWNSGAGNFTLTLSDSSGGGSWPFSVTVAAPVSTARTSAEWIAESPVTGGHFWPLTDFGTASFTSASANSDSLNKSGPIDSSSWSNDEITMVTHNLIVRAQPSGLTDKGSTSAFSVMWEHQ